MVFKTTCDTRHILTSGKRAVRDSNPQSIPCREIALTIWPTAHLFPRFSGVSALDTQSYTLTVNKAMGVTIYFMG